MVRPEVYRTIHKSHRYALFTLAIQAGRIDYAKKESVDKLHGLLLAFKEQLRIHIEMEEKFIHPVLSKRVPGGARKLEEEHREHSQRFNDLLLHMEEIKAKPASFANLGALGLEHYRALNRFISGYLIHIDKEEEKIQPTLWKLCSDDELMGMKSGFYASARNYTLEEVEYILKIMIPADDPDELVELFETAWGAPEEVRKKLDELASSMLTPEELALVKKRLTEA